MIHIGFVIPIAIISVLVGVAIGICIMALMAIQNSDEQMKGEQENGLE